MLLARYKDPIKRSNHPIVVVIGNMVGIRKHYFSYPQDGKERYLCGLGKDADFRKIKYEKQEPIAGDELECLNFPALELGAKNPRIIVVCNEIVIVYDTANAKQNVVFLHDMLLNNPNYCQDFAYDIKSLNGRNLEDFVDTLCNFFAVPHTNISKNKA